MKKIYLFTFLLASLILNAQKPLKLNPDGEMSKKQYEKLIKQRGYQAISTFDTVSLQPVLVYAIYVKNGKQGILDHTGKEVTPAIYGHIAGLQTNRFGQNNFRDYYIIEQNNKRGVISNTGKMVLPMDDYFIDYGNYSDDKFIKTEYFVTKEMQGEKYFNIKGEEIQKPILKLNNNPNTPNRSVSSVQNTVTKSFSDDNPYGKISKRIGKFGVVETKIDNKYKYGVVDLETKKLIVPIEFGFINSNHIDRFIAGNYSPEKYALYDTIGVALAKDLDKIEESNGIYFFTKSGKTAAFDKELKPLTDYVYEGGFHYRSKILTKKDVKKGMINLKNEIVIPFEYDVLNFVTYQIGASRDDLDPFVRATKNRKDGLIDFNGNILIPVEYDELDTEIAARQKNSYPTGGMTMPLDHKITENNQYFIVKKDGKYGLLDRNYKMVLPTIYEDILKGQSSKFVHVIIRNENNKRGEGLFCIDTNEFVFEPQTDNDFSFISGKYIKLKKNNQYALYNLDGKELIQFQNRDIKDVNTIYKGLKQFYSYDDTSRAVMYIGQDGKLGEFVEIETF